MFSVLDGVENFSEWLSNGPVGWIFMNPLMLAVMITLIIVFLHEMYADEDDDRSLTKFIVYTFLVVLIPIIVNNNAIDRKVTHGSYEVTAADMDGGIPGGHGGVYGSMDERDAILGGGRDVSRYNVDAIYGRRGSVNGGYDDRYY